jgi:hypothetical protein
VPEWLRASRRGNDPTKEAPGFRANLPAALDREPALSDTPLDHVRTGGLTLQYANYRSFMAG